MANKKAYSLNERMFVLEDHKKNAEIFDLCFKFQDEIGNIFDLQCIIGNFDTPRSAINMYFAIKTCQGNAQNIRRKLMFIKDECAGHEFMDYALALAQEAATIAQQHTGPGIDETRAQASNLFDFMRKNSYVPCVAISTYFVTVKSIPALHQKLWYAMFGPNPNSHRHQKSGKPANRCQAP